MFTIIPFCIFHDIAKQARHAGHNLGENNDQVGSSFYVWCQGFLFLTQSLIAFPKAFKIFANLDAITNKCWHQVSTWADRIDRIDLIHMTALDRKRVVNVKTASALEP